MLHSLVHPRINTANNQDSLPHRVSLFRTPELSKSMRGLLSVGYKFILGGGERNGTDFYTTGIFELNYAEVF